MPAAPPILSAALPNGEAMNYWVPVSERVPESDATVLIALVDDEEHPVWLGYYEATDGWFSVDGFPIAVTHWTKLPKKP